MKKGILVSLLGLFLIGCDTVINGLTSPEPSYVDLPLGQNKTITINVENGFHKKPYVVSLRIEYPNAMAVKNGYAIAGDKAKKLPFNIRIKGYKVENNKETLFMENDVKQLGYISGGSNTNKREDIAFITHIDTIYLSKGLYKFVITDNSIQNDEYEKIKTSIGIYVLTRKF